MTFWTEQVGALLALTTAVAGLILLLLRTVWTIRAEAAETAAKLAQIGASTSSTLAQVQNSHSTNLRADLDALRTDVLTGHTLAEQTRALAADTNRQLAGLREELREERRRLTRLDEAAHTTHHELFDRLNKLEGKS